MEFIRNARGFSFALAHTTHRIPHEDDHTNLADPLRRRRPSRLLLSRAGPAMDPNRGGLLVRQQGFPLPDLGLGP